MAMNPIVANENEQEKTKIHAAEAATINTEAVISVFGFRLMGAFERNAEGTRVLVCQPTKDPEQKPVTLESVCTSAGVPEDKRNSIDSVIKYLGFTGGIAGIEIDVHQVFYYYSSNEKDIDKDKKIDQEYAFSLGITNTFEPKPEKPLPFTIESISFSLWNSTREKLVESMGIYTILDILGKFSNEQ